MRRLELNAVYSNGNNDLTIVACFAAGRVCAVAWVAHGNFVGNYAPFGLFGYRGEDVLFGWCRNQLLVSIEIVRPPHFDDWEFVLNVADCRLSCMQCRAISLQLGSGEARPW